MAGNQYPNLGYRYRSTQEEVGADSNAIETPSPAFDNQLQLLDATLSSIPDFIYAFDRERRFAYANPAMLNLFGLSADEMLGKTFADLGYPLELAQRLHGQIDRVLKDGVTVEDEVFYRTPSGLAAYFAYLWGPVRGADGSVELVVGVSRDTTERHAYEEALRTSEARLRAATDVAGLGVYSWDPSTGQLEWDAPTTAMWGLPPHTEVNMGVFEAGIHAEDLPHVRRALAACMDPTGDGHYSIEYRVLGRDDHTLRHIASSGQMTFGQGRPVSFIGAVIDVTSARRTEAAIKASEALFRSFADNSSNLIWVADPEAGKIVYRSAAFERIWGLLRAEASSDLAAWMNYVHPDDRRQVEHSLATVRAGEVVQYEYRIVRPTDGAIRLLRETSFPILDEGGETTRIGGITEDLTQDDARQVYLVGGRAAEARRLAGVLRAQGYRVRTFPSGGAFLDMAPVLAHGCVLVDLRKARAEGLAVQRELTARSITLPMIALDAPGAEVGAAVAAMKAGAVDYVPLPDASDFYSLKNAIADCLATARRVSHVETAGARVERLTRREREVLIGLVEGGTNKSIANKLGISPRTVELHRAQVMSRLDASSLTELLQIALSAGVVPSTEVAPVKRR